MTHPDTLQISRAVVEQAPRYHVRQDGFWWWCVKAEDGTRTLLKAGTKIGAERLAATLEAEFQTGVFVGQQAVLQLQAAEPGPLGFQTRRAIKAEDELRALREQIKRSSTK